MSPYRRLPLARAVGEDSVQRGVAVASRAIRQSAFWLVRLAEAEGFEPPVPLGTLAFKSQGSRVSGYVPGCRAAGFRAIRLAQRGAHSSRLLHGCYTPTPSPSALRRCPEPQARGPVSWPLETSSGAR